MRKFHAKWLYSSSWPVSAEKQRIAEEVASILNLKVEIGSGLHERLVHFLSSEHILNLVVSMYCHSLLNCMIIGEENNSNNNKYTSIHKLGDEDGY